MKFFVDTSSLFKKYIDEAGNAAFDQLLAKASEIVVAPTTWIEMNHVIERCLRDKRLTSDGAERLRREIRTDFSYYSIVIWNENLEDKAIQMLRHHPLKTMDAVQLAAGFLSDSDLFITSDHQLHLASKKSLKQVRFI